MKLWCMQQIKLHESAVLLAFLPSFTSTLMISISVIHFLKIVYRTDHWKDHELIQHFTDMRQSDVSEFCSCMCSFMWAPIFVLLQLKAPFPLFLTITPYLKSNPPALKRRECAAEWKAALCTISPLTSIWQLELSVNTSLNHILVPLLCLKAHFWEDLQVITHIC